MMATPHCDGSMSTVSQGASSTPSDAAVQNGMIRPSHLRSTSLRHVDTAGSAMPAVQLEVLMPAVEPYTDSDSASHAANGIDSTFLSAVHAALDAAGRDLMCWLNESRSQPQADPYEEPQ